MTLDQLKEIFRNADTISFAKNMRPNQKLREKEILAGINEHIEQAILERIGEPACWIPHQSIAWLKNANSVSAYCNINVGKSALTQDYIPLFAIRGVE